MRAVRLCIFFFFFFKQKTAYEIGTGDWSSDVCSSDLTVIFSKTYFVSARANGRQTLQTTKVSQKVILPVEGRVFSRNIIHCTNPCLIIFVRKKRVLLLLIPIEIASQEMDFENKVVGTSQLKIHQ